jgi:hypothetical protein
MSPSFRSLHVARFVVNVFDVHLLQLTRRAEATVCGSSGTDHRQDLVIHWIAPDRVHQKRYQVRVGNAIIQLIKYHIVGLRDTVMAVRRYLTLYVNALSTAQRARLNVRSYQHTAVKGAHPDSGLT